MPRTRRLLQRPLKIQPSRRERMYKATEMHRRKRLIRELLLEAARKHGFNVDDKGTKD